MTLCITFRSIYKYFQTRDPVVEWYHFTHHMNNDVLVKRMDNESYQTSLSNPHKRVQTCI